MTKTIYFALKGAATSFAVAMLGAAGLWPQFRWQEGVAAGIAVGFVAFWRPRA